MQDKAETSETTQDQITKEVQVEYVEKAYTPLPEEKERIHIQITEELAKVLFDASERVKHSLAVFQEAERTFKEANTQFTALLTVKLEGTGINISEVLGADLDTKGFQLIIIKK